MTFTYKIKSEIYRSKAFRGPRRAAQAYGLLLFGKHFGEEAIGLVTENKRVTKLYANAITDLVGITESITIKETKHTGNSVFAVSVDSREDREKVLAFFGHREGAEGIRMENLAEEGDLAAFLSGAFLACGNVTDPQKSYHLEFVVPSPGLAQPLCDAIGLILPTPKLTRRRGQEIVYYKESENIEDLLATIGASTAALELMEVKIYKDMRNKVNRVTNCETANIEKTVTAAMQQIEDINLILRERGEGALEDDLRELAFLRLQNPEMSLRELGENLSENISRSGVNHRLKRIGALADEIRRIQTAARK
ncbi:MAG: DNA-binding protein WhiA [Oscillospiraceae bacterium]|nr:MAG: DNA-binding protein WhiA [Oscillospiraceae bacterium]